MKVKMLIFMIVTMCMMLVACGGNSKIAGTWVDVSGKVLTFSQDGTCKNVVFINTGADKITYKMSSNTNADGQYELVVKNGDYDTEKFSVKIINDNEIEIYPVDMGPLNQLAVYTLSRK